MGNIGERIKLVRAKAALTQSEFAERLYISQSYLSGVEAGNEKAAPKLLKLICLEYGVNGEWLLRGKGEIFIDGADEPKITLPVKLKQLRKQRGLTQKELAQLTGISLSAIIQYENGNRKPDFKAVKALESFFGISAGDLNGDTERKQHEYDKLKSALFERMKLYTEDYHKCLTLYGMADRFTSIACGRFEGLFDIFLTSGLSDEYEIWKGINYHEQKQKN